MGIRIEQPFNEGRTRLEVAYPEGGELEPSRQTLRQLRERAVEYAFGQRNPLDGSQHAAIEEFVELKKATLGHAEDKWETVAQTPCRIIVGAGAVTELYGQDYLKVAQLTYPQETDWGNHPIAGQYPGSAAYLIYEFLGV